IPENNKIDMEDYVSTYIHQYASYLMNDEKIAVLIGKTFIINGSRVTFISGAVKGEYSERRDGMLALSEKSREYINSQIDEYFRGLDVVGWVYIQPGYGDYLNEVHRQYHKENFKENNQLLFLIDPLENLSSFFAWNKEMTDLESIGGYIIYYDKNQGMNEYMLNNRTVRIKTEESAEPVFSKHPQEVLNLPRTSRMRAKMIAQQKKLVNVFGSLSAILFIACFIMGVGLVENGDRISNLERQLAAVNDSYKYLLAQVTSDKTQSVFAAEKSEQISSGYESDYIGESTTYETVTETETNTQSNTQTDSETETSSISEPDYENYSQLYTVSEGDNLYLISRKFFGDESKVEDIKTINKIEDADTIYYGQVIKIPLE
ncbi:MAG: LysM peptidoglycan-binding domain-containing protein, partial [Firmicutes bacterium]|nr:LysM peptidoglycan-binding domain-containing protein [Bacillota bacterium]